MPTPNTPSATPIQQAGRSSRGAPHRLNGEALAFLIQCAGIAAVFAAAGFFAVWFLLLPTPAQAMIGYGLVLALCVVGIVAGLRRKVRR